MKTNLFIYVIYFASALGWLCNALVAKNFLKIPEGIVEEVQLKCKLKTCLELLLLCFYIKC